MKKTNDPSMARWISDFLLGLKDRNIGFGDGTTFSTGSGCLKALMI